jgi:putative ABC transport system permease protein
LGEVFRSAAQAGEHYRPQMLVIRTRDDGASAVGTIAALIRGTADDLPALTVRTLEDLADEQNRSWRMGRTVFGGFGVMAILLASIGLYGVLAFQARQRTAEIGVRMALGATRRDILRLVVRQGFGLVAVGWLLGLTLTLVVVGHLEALLFEVSPTDGGTFAIASAVIIAAGLSGCLFPALHAARVDPVVALRQE